MLSYKKNAGLSYTLGITITIELLKTMPKNVKKIYFHSSFRKEETYNQIIKLCEKNRILYEENDKPFQSLSKKENDYVIGEFYKFQTPFQNDTNHLVLVNPSNSGNLGTIIRSMSGFGMNHLAIITPSVDLFDPKVIRASMGSFFHINWKLYTSFEAYKQDYSRKIYSFMLDGHINLSNITIEEPFSLVFGNEATGLDSSFLQYDSIRIQHNTTIDSLNLPIAVSIALYEFTKNKFKEYAGE